MYLFVFDLYKCCGVLINFLFLSFPFFFFLVLQNIKIHANFVNNGMITGQLFPSLQNTLFVLVWFLTAEFSRIWVFIVEQIKRDHKVVLFLKE